MRPALPAALALLALSAAPAAAAEDDGNVWLGQFATINASDKVYVRIEQRTFEERADSQWRLRQFVQLRVPVDGSSRIVAYTEPFVDLDEGSVQSGGVSIWRNFVGVSVPPAKGIEVVPGYLNQHVFRDGQDRSDHTANVNLFMTF